MHRRRFQKIALVCLGLMMSPHAPATEDFPIAGTYMQNRACPPEGAGGSRWRVSITPDRIVYGAGTCILSNPRIAGNAVTVRAACQHKSGRTLSSDVTFTIRDDRNLEMNDEYGTYRAVLNRCTEPTQSTERRP